MILTYSEHSVKFYLAVRLRTSFWGLLSSTVAPVGGAARTTDHWTEFFRAEKKRRNPPSTVKYQNALSGQGTRKASNRHILLSILSVSLPHTTPFSRPFRLFYATVLSRPFYILLQRQRCWTSIHRPSRLTFKTQIPSFDRTTRLNQHVLQVSSEQNYFEVALYRTLPLNEDTQANVHSGGCWAFRVRAYQWRWLLYRRRRGNTFPHE